MPRDVLRVQLRSVALAILADGERVSTQRLREHGVRGGTAVLIQLREELVASGELPPEAAARVYAPPKHPPGKSSQRTAISSQEFSSLIADKLTADRSRADRSRADKLTADSSDSDGRSRRRSRRLVQEYNIAVRRIFGRARARQIGAAP
jgi:hypothetical protein